MVLDQALIAAARARFAASAFTQWIGLELVTLDDGYSEVALNLKPHHLNPGGLAHGGIVATILDISMGIALRTQLPAGWTHVTVNLDVQYIEGARGGRIIGRGRAVKSGGRVTYSEADLVHDDGRLLARSSGTMIPLEPRLG
jgi:uncharacterized protein (TIGR00369 family)